VNVSDQLSLLRLRLGEPENADDARFTPSQLLLALNSSRRWFCEESHSLQIKDQQNTIVGTKLYTMKNDVIKFYAVECGGLQVDPVTPANWRGLVGDDEDMAGVPVVYKYWARQIQLFYVPDAVKVLLYHGYAYPTALVLNGTDGEFLDRQSEGAIWKAAVDIKAADERPFDYELAEADRVAKEFRDQYAPKGPRQVNSGPSGPSPLSFVLNRGG
jgi:hypothetical protein